MNTLDAASYPAPPEAPELQYVATFNVEVDETLTVGKTIDGIRAVVPIRGGNVFGPTFSGRILDAGADFQQYPYDGVAYLSASYVLELTGGHRILVENRALRTGTPADLKVMMNGGEVDPGRVYFRCLPRLTADQDGPYGWVNRTLFVGSGQRMLNGVLIHIFSLT